MIFEFRKRIYGYECDVYGHLNNANYLQILECARSEAMLEMDMSITRMRERNLQIFIRSFSLDYRKAIGLEEVIIVHSWYDQLTRVKGRWIQEILNSRQELCFRAEMIVVFASEGRSHRLPQDVYELFLSYKEPASDADPER